MEQLPADEVARLRRLLVKTPDLTDEVCRRTHNIIRIYQIEMGLPPIPNEEHFLGRYVTPVLTAYSELILDSRMLVVPRERWDALRRLEDRLREEDWDDD